MNEKAAAEELTFIKNIINESRKSFAMNGKPYIFWGILIVIGLFLESFREIFDWEFYYMFYVWIGLIAVGWGYSYYDAKKCNKEQSTKSLGSKLLGSVWLACGISMTLIGILGTVSGAIDGIYVSPVLSVILAIAYFLTGVIYDYKWLRNVSIGWWLGAVYMFFFPGISTNLIMAFMMIVFQIIPGVVLLNKVKKTTMTTA